VFRDLEGTGTLLPYEDWRLSADQRAEDLKNRLTDKEMAALMVHSEGQPLPAMPRQMMNVGTYDGKTFPESISAKASDLTDQQKDMLNQGVRHFLVAGQKDVKTAVEWSNHLQKRAEELPHGIPVNISTDPRHGAGVSGVEFKNTKGAVSHWPEGWGLAAAADPALAETYGKIVAKEYRALGITTALGPQIDLGSEPRWFRISGTLGSDVECNIKLTRAICDGLQTTEGSEDGWGPDSVIAMAKHWPGGGTGEGGRDAHYPFGKYAVYPGNRFETHLRPFTEGAFRLEKGTGSVGAIMPYYTVSWGQDKKDGKNVGNSFSTYIIKDLLLGTYQYDGVICTDWDIISDKRPHVGMYVMGGKCYGVEELSIPQRVLLLIENGVNQIGGLDDRSVVDAALELGRQQYSQEEMHEKLSISAYKILRNLFRVGLFDHPYLDAEESEKIVGCQEHQLAGWKAQIQSLVLLKNKGVLPLKKGLRIYVPQMKEEAHYNFVRMITPGSQKDPLEGQENWKTYFTRTDTPEEADAAIVFIRSPYGRNGYEFDMMKMRTGEPQPELGYHPISLQYRPYVAKEAREVSIAGGDPNEESTNRSYKDRGEITANEADLDNVIAAKKAMGDKPVIVVLKMDKPTVPAEFEPYSDGILADFGVDAEAIWAVLFGEAICGGKLPCILPKDMETIERHCEDVAEDILPYTDSEGNVYTMGFGL
jgi:beta-glucosidase